MALFDELATLSPLEGLDRLQLLELAGQDLLYLEPGQPLMRRGQFNDRLHILLSGSLQVQVAGRPGAPVNIIDAGQCIGEVSLLDGQTVTVDVVAEQPCRLLTIDRQTFWELIDRSPPWRRYLLELLAGRLRNSNEVLHRYERHASVDLLTGLNNRRWLEGNLERLVNRCRHDGQPITVLMLDLDHFKRLNDGYGHPTGDRALAAVAATLQQHLRPDDALARYGGEEMTVLLPGSDLEQGRQTGERLRRAVEALVVTLEDGSRLPGLTISVGVAQLQPRESGVRAIARADAALYRAKQQGRNRVELDRVAPPAQELN